MTAQFKELMQKTNPRKVINDLIQQATGYTMQVYEVDGVRTLGERVEYFDKEKFAELIVNATCNVILHYDNVDEGVAVAKKHFGVTE
jgi:hypothetical protein